LINVSHNNLIEEFNSTFKTIEYNVCIEKRIHDPEDILRIAELTYTKMVEKGSWNSNSNIQETLFVKNTLF